MPFLASLASGAIKRLARGLTALSDIYYNLVTLLLNSETPTTSFITDASANNYSIVINGDTKPMPFHPYNGDGYYSNSFGGTDYLSGTPTSALTMAGDFTIEFWVYFSALDTAERIPVNCWNTGSGWLISTQSSAWNFKSNGSFVLTYSTVAPAAGQWYHVAVSRSGGSTNNIKMFINGAQVAQGSSNNTISPALSAGGLIIGAGQGGTGQQMTGYVSNLRIVNGTALYTAAFTPSTTPLTVVTNTQLLTCLTNRFVDKSANNYALTLGGAPKVSKSVPFTLVSNYSTYGSAYFDGTGDYLALSGATALNLSSTTCSFELWVYPTTVSNASNIQLFQSGTGNLAFLILNGGALQPGQYGTSGFAQTTATIPANAWAHLAVTRDASNNWRTFINGVLQAYQSYTFTPNNSGLQIGGGSGSNAYYTGYISDFRATVGSIPTEYTTASTTVGTTIFTPPTGLLSVVTNTQLLTCQYTGGSNNYGIIDNSNFNNVIARNGNATQGTFSPYSQTGWSNYFNGSTDYLGMPAALNTAMGTGFSGNIISIECWVYPTAWIAANAYYTTIMGTYQAVAANGRWYFGVTGGTTASGNLKFTYTTGTGSQVDLQSTTALTYLNKWNHVAVTIDATTAASTTIKLFANGVLTDTFTSQNFTTQTAYYSTPYIGGNMYLNPWTGYISNLRVLKGAFNYTGSYAVPSNPLAATANTVFLACQSNRFVDNSVYGINPIAITVTGSPRCEAISPFGSIPEIVPISYSTYFNGTTDYITGPSNTALITTGQFTFECWVYPTTFANDKQIFENSHWDIGQNGGFRVYTKATTGTVAMGASTGTFNTYPDVFVTTTALIINTWSHIAITRNSGDLISCFINGVSAVTPVSRTTSLSLTSDGNIGLAKIGASISDGGGGTSFFNGYISNVRIIQGNALYTSAFTPPTQPLTALTGTMFLASQSSFTSDNSSNNYALLGVGTPRVYKFNPFGYTAQSTTSYTPSVHGGSVYLDGTGDYLTVPYNPSFDIPASSEFTFEAWAYTSSATLFTFANRNWSYGGTGATWAFNLNNGVTPEWGLAGTGSSTYVMATSTISGQLGAWNHYAFTRDSTGVVRIFVNGVLGVSRTDTQAMSSASGAIYIGVSSNLASPYSTGYISDMRMVVGKSLYNTQFIPPIQSVSNYSNKNPSHLLLNFNNGGIVDYHANNVFESVGGLQLSTTIKKFGNSSIGPMWNSTGVSNYLVAPHTPTHNMIIGDFTIEFWFYPTSWTVTNGWILCKDGVAGTNYPQWGVRLGGSGNILFQIGASNGATTTQALTSTGTVALNTWSHVACVRSGTTLAVYINGVASGTLTQTIAMVASSRPLYINWQGSGATNDGVNGYIDDLRITNGFARYTSGFVVPVTVPTQ